MAGETRNKSRAPLPLRTPRPLPPARPGHPAAAILLGEVHPDEALGGEGLPQLVGLAPDVAFST